MRAYKTTSDFKTSFNLLDLSAELHPVLRAAHCGMPWPVRNPVLMMFIPMLLLLGLGRVMHFQSLVAQDWALKAAEMQEEAQEGSLLV